MLRFGEAPFLECSSKGDKRFSAFYAQLSAFNHRTIEEIYQSSKIFSDGSTGLSIKEAKGKVAVNQEELKRLYDYLWHSYLVENPELIKIICSSTGLSDIYGQEGHVCQAEVLWRARVGFLSGDWSICDTTKPFENFDSLLLKIKFLESSLNGIRSLFQNSSIITPEEVKTYFTFVNKLQNELNDVQRELMLVSTKSLIMTKDRLKELL